jgi:hypothetical protein
MTEARPNQSPQPATTVISNVALDWRSVAYLQKSPGSPARQAGMTMTDISINWELSGVGVYWTGRRTTWTEICWKFRGMFENRNILGKGNFGTVYKVLIKSFKYTELLKVIEWETNKVFAYDIQALSEGICNKGHE